MNNCPLRVAWQIARTVWTSVGGGWWRRHEQELYVIAENLTNRTTRFRQPKSESKHFKLQPLIKDPRKEKEDPLPPAVIAIFALVQRTKNYPSKEKTYGTKIS